MSNTNQFSEHKYNLDINIDSIEHAKATKIMDFIEKLDIQNIDMVLCTKSINSDKDEQQVLMG